MKNIFLSLICVLAITFCQAQNKQYTIHGQVSGSCNGMKVLLQTTDYPAKTIDSAVIKNNQFVMNGQIPAPGLYTWVIDRTPAGEESSERNWLSSKFYLENSDITFKGDIQTLPTYFWNPDRKGKAVIEGSASEDLHQAFRKSIAPLSKKSSQLFEEYLEKYHRPSSEGIFNTREGIRLAREMTVLDQQIDQATFDFIRQHPESVVAFDQASYFLEGEVKLTAKQIDELSGILSKVWANTPQLADFKSKAEKAKKIAIGVPYQDIELTNPEGQVVKLSQYIPKGKYVMLEFWASWCGPCRGEIPHLKHVYKAYKDKGFEIISVSIDAKDKDWKKAMQEENMDWIQLNDSKEFKGPAQQVYNVTGVPYCILLDKEGRIYKTNMRGAYLDAELEKLIP